MFSKYQHMMSMRYQHIVKLVGVIKKDDISLKEVICSDHKTKYINEESDLDIPSKFFNAIYELLQIRLNLMIALLVIHLGSYKRILRYKDGTSSAIKKKLLLCKDLLGNQSYTKLLEESKKFSFSYLQKAVSVRK